MDINANFIFYSFTVGPKTYFIFSVLEQQPGTSHTSDDNLQVVPVSPTVTPTSEIAGNYW